VHDKPGTVHAKREFAASFARVADEYNFQIPMLLGKVEGSVVATTKDAHVAGRKLLLVRPQFTDRHNPTRFRTGADTFVAVDSVGAGVGEMVVICQGSSARLTPDLKEAPVDAVVMGIVDVVDVLGQQVYSSKA
jgi:ethanolamine utilization protein EutN